VYAIPEGHPSLKKAYHQPLQRPQLEQPLLRYVGRLDQPSAEQPSKPPRVQLECLPFGYGLSQTGISQSDAEVLKKDDGGKNFSLAPLKVNDKNEKETLIATFS